MDLHVQHTALGCAEESVGYSISVIRFIRMSGRPVSVDTAATTGGSKPPALLATNQRPLLKPTSHYFRNLTTGTSTTTKSSPRHHGPRYAGDTCASRCTDGSRAKHGFGYQNITGDAPVGRGHSRTRRRVCEKRCAAGDNPVCTHQDGGRPEVQQGINARPHLW